MDEIEELRAKAISSITSSANTNSLSAAAASATASGGGNKFKSPKSKEEGELSSSEDAELNTCSAAPPKSTNMGETMSHTLRNNTLQNIKAEKNAAAAHLSTAGMQLRPSVVQNYQKRFPKHFRRQQTTFRSISNQALHWHAKDSKNNLVISFSDDDSESESERCNAEKDVTKMDFTSIAEISRNAAASLPKQAEQEPCVIEPISRKESANHATISSVCSAYENSGPEDPSAENGYHLQRQTPAINTSTRQDLGNVLGSAMGDQRLESLRHKNIAQENLLKVQNKLVLQKGAPVDSDSNQHGPHAMELEAMATGIRRHAHDSITEFEANEQSKKRLKLDKYSPSFDFNMPSKPGNHKTFQKDNSFSHYQHDEDNIVKSTVIENRNSYVVPLASNLHDGFFSKNDDIARNTRSEKFSSKVSNPASNNVGSMHVIVRNQQTTSKTDVRMPLETFFMHEKSSKCGSGNKEASIEGEGSMPFHSLVKLEELHDKELEDAQEHRRKCELEERHTLKAYRKVQRALIEANKRCSFLYRKRELFSAKFKAFVMEASSSMCPSNWLNQQIPQEDQFLEPDASTSIHRDSSADGAVPHAHIPNESTDDDEEDFPSRLVESRSGDVDVEIEKAPFVDNSQDYELLEASLRSELVARLGVRASSKVNDTSKGEFDFEKRAADAAEDREPSPLVHEMMPSLEKKQPSSLEGVERPTEGSCLFHAHSDVQSHVNVFPSNEELQSIIHVDNNNSFPKDSWNTTCTGFPLPSSDLHILCRHIYLAFPGCHTGAFKMKENDYIMTSKENCTPNIIGEILNFTRNTTIGFKGLYGSSVEVDPFWPLCMFEFRGKCNDEECLWQHMRKDVHGAYLTNGKSDDVPRFSCSILRHTLPIPTYQIGPYLIKADSHLSQSILARSNWKYHERGFCASFSLPFSVQRILPSDAPCLQPGDNPVADDYSWNRLSLYYQSQDSTIASNEQIKQGSGDVEQSLEMALDQFDVKFCEPDRKKALSLLARAIEAYPSSVVLWIVYLHIYYIKEKVIGKDDMFLHAVQHNKGSYELWLLYINSRLLCDDRLNAYDRALKVLCHIGVHDRMKNFSACILDIFLQMIDFLCMSGQVEKAFSRICGLLPDTEFDKFSDPDIRTCLTVPDICLFWVLCIYFIVYEKLPDTTVQQFEFVKNLPFGLNWPSAQVELDRKELALENMKLAMTQMASQLVDRAKGTDQASCRSLHFLAVSHVKCVGALQGSPGSTELLVKYLKLYPSCMELVLMVIRSSENCTTDVKISSFEEALHNWPKETPGIQCLWNQYMEYALANSRIDLAEKLMDNWYQDFSKSRDLSSFCSLVHSKTKDDAYGILNLCLYWMLQKNVVDARIAIDKSLELAAPEDYEHFVKEHAAFIISNEHEPWKHFPLGNLPGLLIRYLADHRSSLDLLPLSRWFIRTIKKPRIQQMVNNILGPVSASSSLMNSVLEVCYGPFFLPEKFNDIKAAVNFVELLMEMMPANYELALSVYRVFSSYFVPIHPDCSTMKFWACTLLINSIFQAAPVAPEYTWLEAANLLNNSESMEISLRFHKQAISVYPFSVNIWRSYANLHNTTDHASEIIEAAQERGIDLNDVLN